MQKTILVIGATGMLGEPVARRLKEDNFRVRVMTRDINKARKTFDKTFETVVGDVTDSTSLEKALDGCFGVHVSISPPEIDQLGVPNIVSMASKKGLERITYISMDLAFEENAWFPPVKQKLSAEKAIQESGIPYTIFCPTASMEALAMFVSGSRAAVLGKQPNPYHYFAADDLARMVSASYGLEKAVNKKLFIYGPEGILTHEAVRRYCSVFHPQIKKVSTIPYWLANFIATITGNKEMKFGIKLLAFCEKVGEGGDPTEANRILGAPKITLDEWLKRTKDKLCTPSVG